MSSSVYAVILVGSPSSGKRLRPVTHSVPKPLVFIGSKPLVWHHVRACAGIPNLLGVLLVGTYAHSAKDQAAIEEYVKILNNSGDFSFPIHYLDSTPQYRGTAGCLVRVASALELSAATLDSLPLDALRRASAVAISFVDVFPSRDLPELVQWHFDSPQPPASSPLGRATLGVILKEDIHEFATSVKDPEHNFGLVHRDPSSVVLRFVPRVDPSAAVSVRAEDYPHVSAGFSVFDAAPFWGRLRSLESAGSRPHTPLMGINVDLGRVLEPARPMSPTSKMYADTAAPEPGSLGSLSLDFPSVGLQRHAHSHVTIFSLDRDVLGGSDGELVQPPNGAVACGGVRAYQVSGPWMQIRHHEDLLESNRLLAECPAEPSCAPIAPGAHPVGSSGSFEVVGEGVFIGKHCTIANGVKLGPNVVIASGTTVAEGARIKDAIIFPMCQVGRHCVILSSVVGVGCTIGDWSRVMGKRATIVNSAQHDKGTVSVLGSSVHVAANTFVYASIGARHFVPCHRLFWITLPFCLFFASA